MDAKQYLMQVSQMKENIQDQEDKIQRLRDTLDVQGISYDKERVQTSPDFDKFAKVFAKIEDEQKELDALKERFIDFRLTVIEQIYSLDEVLFRQVLNGKYIDYMTLKQCAVDMGYSYDYVRELHNKALHAFEDKFPQ